MLSAYGWIDGLTALTIVAFNSLFGIYCIYVSKKQNIRLLFYLGIANFFIGLFFLGVLWDFLTVLITNSNIINPYGLIALLSYVWSVPATVLTYYWTTSVIFPKKKWYFIVCALVLSSVAEILIFLDPISSFNFIYPENPGEGLIDYNLNLTSLSGVLLGIVQLGGLVVAVGFLSKVRKTKGVIRKKFFFLAIGLLLFVWSIASETLIVPGFFLLFNRTLYIISFIFQYLAFREEPEKKEKLKPKKEVKVKEDIFRLSKTKPLSITEEEVTYFREKKICLVCKGKATKFTFICDSCNALYCNNCAEALSNLENACWVCNTPIDETKPSKPFEIDQEEISVENAEKGKKESEEKTKKGGSNTEWL